MGDHRARQAGDSRALNGWGRKLTPNQPSRLRNLRHFALVGDDPVVTLSGAAAWSTRTRLEDVLTRGRQHIRRP
jgi:hypothetical protein